MDSSKITSSFNDTMMGSCSIDAISVGSGTDTISAITTGTSPWYTNTLNTSLNNSWVTTTITDNTSLPGQSAVIEANGKMSLKGDKADVEINGVSLMKTLKTLEERLHVLRPNPELEAEWDQLKELGDQYRKLEAEFKEKSKMWATLKK